MSKPDMNKIEFHAVVVVDCEEIKQAKFDILASKKEALAADLGVLIAKTKGWRMNPVNTTVVSNLDLYVFTRNELRDFIDASIKEKLVQMSNRKEEADIKNRLILLSERA